MEDELDMVIAMNNIDATKREALVDTYKSCTIEQLAEEIVSLRAELENEQTAHQHALIDLALVTKERDEAINQRDYYSRSFLASNKAAGEWQEKQYALFAIERKALEFAAVEICKREGHKITIMECVDYFIKKAQES
jgi:hypothetical protein